jgi:hypothetical protein
MPDYLSTDPTAGVADGRYLSQDPTDGVTVQQSAGSVINPATVGAANAARAGAARAGLQVATSPNLGRAVNALSRPGAGAVARAVGVSGGLPGYVIGEAISNPSVGRAVETGVRAGGSFLSRMLSTPLARAATGIPGVIASMVFEPGDRPAGETPERTAARQLDYARQYKEQVNRAAGYEVITGSTAPEIIESIARYRGQR